MFIPKGFPGNPFCSIPRGEDSFITLRGQFLGTCIPKSSLGNKLCSLSIGGFLIGQFLTYMYVPKNYPINQFCNISSLGLLHYSFADNFFCIHLSLKDLLEINCAVFLGEDSFIGRSWTIRGLHLRKMMSSNENGNKS
ncbi:hypothetical protein CEXT_323291 [Caerostris extrusa]|uniref:Uncharacterized protein n=1 Tax=Caerostris extrusa TaxID=172846 RepID=A0AAV4VHV0_CAEEX|nr:hypothetical protein CEXT_323291 [Caerostris extrusa]